MVDIRRSGHDTIENRGRRRRCAAEAASPLRGIRAMWLIMARFMLVIGLAGAMAAGTGRAFAGIEPNEVPVIAVLIDSGQMATDSDRAGLNRLAADLPFTPNFMVCLLQSAWCTVPVPTLSSKDRLGHINSAMATIAGRARNAEGVPRTEDISRVLSNKVNRAFKDFWNDLGQFDKQERDRLVLIVLISPRIYIDLNSNGPLDHHLHNSRVTDACFPGNIKPADMDPEARLRVVIAVPDAAQTGSIHPAYPDSGVDVLARIISNRGQRRLDGIYQVILGCPTRTDDLHNWIGRTVPGDVGKSCVIQPGVRWTIDKPQSLSCAPTQAAAPPPLLDQILNAPLAPRGPSSAGQKQAGATPLTPTAPITNPGTNARQPAQPPVPPPGPVAKAPTVTSPAAPPPQAQPPVPPPGPVAKAPTVTPPAAPPPQAQPPVPPPPGPVAKAPTVTPPAPPPPQAQPPVPSPPGPVAKAPTVTSPASPPPQAQLPVPVPPGPSPSPSPQSEIAVAPVPQPSRQDKPRRPGPDPASVAMLADADPAPVITGTLVRRPLRQDDNTGPIVIEFARTSGGFDVAIGLVGPTPGSAPATGASAINRLVISSPLRAGTYGIVVTPRQRDATCAGGRTIRGTVSIAGGAVTPLGITLDLEVSRCEQGTTSVVIGTLVVK